MPAKRGSTLLIKRHDGSSFVTVGALQSATLTLNGNPIDVTTADDVDGNNEVWQAFITGLKSLSVSGNGIAKQIEPVQSVYEDWASGTLTDYQVFVPYVGTWELAMIVGNMEFSGPYDGVLGFSLSLQGAEAPTFTAAT